METEDDCAKEGLRMAAELATRGVEDEASPPPLGAGKDLEILSRLLLLLLLLRLLLLMLLLVWSGEFAPDSLGGVWRYAGVVVRLDSAEEMGFER